MTFFRYLGIKCWSWYVGLFLVIILLLEMGSTQEKNNLENWRGGILFSHEGWFILVLSDIWLRLLESWKGPGTICQLLVSLPILTDACPHQKACLYAGVLFSPSSSPLHNLNLCVLGRPVLCDLNAPPFSPVLDPPLCLS